MYTSSSPPSVHFRTIDRYLIRARGTYKGPTSRGHLLHCIQLYGDEGHRELVEV